MLMIVIGILLVALVVWFFLGFWLIEPRNRDHPNDDFGANNGMW